jgi:hypothetical protein
MINKKEIIRKYESNLNHITKEYKDDPDTAHFNADKEITNLLIDLGLTQIAKLYISIEKWYS